MARLIFSNKVCQNLCLENLLLFQRYHNFSKSSVSARIVWTGFTVIMLAAGLDHGPGVPGGYDEASFRTPSYQNFFWLVDDFRCKTNA